MKIYTCCPNSDCGAHQEALSFLHENGIEPSLDVDDDGHFLEFDTPKYWSRKRAIAFRKRFFRHVGGFVICYCGEFWQDETDSSGFFEGKCELCGQHFRVCPTCVERGLFDGCPYCDSEEATR